MEEKRYKLLRACSDMCRIPPTYFLQWMLSHLLMARLQFHNGKRIMDKDSYRGVYVMTMLMSRLMLLVDARRTRVRDQNRGGREIYVTSTALYAVIVRLVMYMSPCV